jgi:superfamily II helicase
MFEVNAYHGTSTGRMPPRRAPELMCSSIEKGNAIFDTLFELKRVHEIGLFIIDECHYLFDSMHAASLETLICKIKHVLGRSCVILAMSATLPRFSDVARYLSKICAKILHFRSFLEVGSSFRSTFRPVPLSEYVFCPNFTSEQSVRAPSSVSSSAEMTKETKNRRACVLDNNGKPVRTVERR